MTSSPRAHTSLRQQALDNYQTPRQHSYGSPSIHGNALRMESPPWNQRAANAARHLWSQMRRRVTPSRARGRREMYEEIREREAQARRSFAEGSEPEQRRSRILLRDSYDHQSVGRWNIKRVGGDWVHMYLDDWFNTIVHLPMLRLLLLMVVIYVLCVFSFGLMYLSFSDECGMDFSDRLEAYYFSLETMATIGYGTQDYFFGHCWEPLAIINVQVVCGLVIESLYFGIIFHRLTRGRHRQSTVLFSDKAVVRRVDGSYYLVFQVCELRRHHLLDAKIRVFAVRHERDEHGAAYYQAHRMQLRRPRDDMGGMLLMALPQLVVHKLDAASPLVPAETWISARGPRAWRGLAPNVPPSPSFGEGARPKYTRGDSSRTNAAAIPSPHKCDPPPKPRMHRRRPSVESRMFAPFTASASHVSDEAFEDESDSAPATPPAPPPRPAQNCGAEDSEFRAELNSFFFDRDVEIVAIVEGSDEITSRLVQARHSYAIENFAWWHNFAPCVFRQPGGSCLVDFSEFHRTLEPGEDRGRSSSL